MRSEEMQTKIMNIGGQEVICRFEDVRTDGTFTTYRTTALLTKDEFMLAYNTWVRGKEE